MNDNRKQRVKKGKVKSEGDEREREGGEYKGKKGAQGGKEEGLKGKEANIAGRRGRVQREKEGTEGGIKREERRGNRRECGN